MEKLRVQLEPTNIVGGARKGFELLKVTDQTVGLYRDVKWRTFEDLQTAESLQSAAILHPGNAQEEPTEYEKDVLLEQMEAKIFKMVDESDRSLFIDYMRSETELFLLFADWTEKQRRKLVDMQLRNSDVWGEVLRHKRNLIKELQSLTQIFQLMKTSPVLAEGASQELVTNAEAVRQMSILGAVNQANEVEMNKETIIALKRRALVGAELSEQLRATKNTLAQGVLEQSMFLEIIDRLTRRWNVIKVPYQQQVFQASDVNYPYRAELWVELVSLPANYWAVESLEDISLSLAPMLWEAADNAGYQPAIDFSDVDAWKEKRLARTFGHPFLLSPPVPVSSPFGQAPWAEVFAASKAEEEKLPEEAWGNELLGGLGPDRENDDKAPVNIVVRLSGDVGIAVKESKRLQVQIKLVRLAGDGGLDFTAAQEPIVSDEHLCDRAEDSKCFKRVSMTSGLDAVHENLEDFLTGVQRVCIERGMFAVLQSQAMRVLREAGVNDEETVACVQERLRGSRTVKIEVLKNLILLRPVRLTPDSSLFKITSRPEMTAVPASWCVWPFSGPGKTGRERPLVYACSKARISVRSCLSDEIKFVIHDIPILASEAKAVIASADVEVRILFKKLEPQVVSQTPSEHQFPLERQLAEQIGWLKHMAVCFIRQQVLSAMDSRDLVNNAFDIYPANLPGLRTKHQGALLLQRLTSWILTHLAMANF